LYNRDVRAFFLILSLVPCIAAPPPPAPPKNPVVVITTSLGVIKAEIDVTNTPITGNNFLQYVDDKFYDGTIFNRVIAGFVVQGGGYTPDLHLKKARGAIKNEGASKRKNLAGTLSMAHFDDPDSATCHFFISVGDNKDLDWVDDAHPGYAVFGKVISGMDVVNKIAKTPTSTQQNMPDVPTTPIVVQSIRRE
jgi:cyclophilin family peptidyl-prolyl cis-trans isomerase